MSTIKYGEHGIMCFDKLWEYMKKKNVKKQNLVDDLNINKRTIYKLVNNENVTVGTICAICNYLNCKPQTIMEYIPPKKEK